MHMTTRQAWTITEVAQRCGVSKSTVRRYQVDGKFPNAWKDQSKPPQWRIPVEDLLAVGWKPVDPHEVSPEQVLSTPSERERELESLLAIERTKREAAEHIAAIATKSADDLSRALRMLEAAPVRRPEPGPDIPVSTTADVPVNAPETPRRRRWWHL